MSARAVKSAEPEIRGALIQTAAQCAPFTRPQWRALTVCTRSDTKRPVCARACVRGGGARSVWVINQRVKSRALSGPGGGISVHAPPCEASGVSGGPWRREKRTQFGIWLRLRHYSKGLI